MDCSRRPWGGIIFALLPENVRVAFAEGNLPRVLATALLPATFYCLLRVMDRKNPSRMFALPMALSISLIVLSHAMMGAIFLASLGLFSILYWLLGGSHAASLFRAILSLFAGLLLSGWWLLPSLTGGITELNQSAVSEALANFPLSVSFNPLPRSTNLEIFYIGLGLGLGALLAFLSWRLLGPLTKALLLAGGTTVLVTTTVFNPFFNSLPLHQLFWPIRFSGFASFTLLLALVSCWRPLAPAPGIRWQRSALLLVLLVAIWDGFGSSALIHLRAVDRTITTAAQRLQATTGWRVATADLSMLGSSPSYWLSSVAGREQIYGWGYQGARIATNVSSINYAMDHGYFDYAVDRLEELGVDDILLLEGAMKAEKLDERLLQAGFGATPLDRRLTLFHKDGVPRAFTVAYDVLGIGGGAQNLALLFPKVALGRSTNVDDYDLAYLAKFKALFLSRFGWENMEKAERLIQEYAKGGGTVLVDLTGSPMDVLSREPKFLGVYGEPVQMTGSAVLEREGKRTYLLPFSFDTDFWQAHTPQGLDREVITFDYHRQVGVALGYKEYGQGRVWFTGLNLPFHALLTRDPVAIQLLEEALGMRAGELPSRRPVPLQDYQAGEEGYRFSLVVDTPQEVLIPVAAHEGATVWVDRLRVPSTTVDNLISLYTPAGRHQVIVTFEKTGIYALGQASTVAGLVLLFAFLPGLPAILPRIVRRSARAHP